MKDYRESHKEERITRQYEDDVYRKGSYDDWLWRYEKNILALEVKKIQKKVPHISYLDFGCGTGRILSYLENIVDEAVGVDISSSMLSRARKHIQRAKLLEADLTRDDVISAMRFDLITMFRVLLNSDPLLRTDLLKVVVPKLRDEQSRVICNVHGNTWSHRIITKIWLRIYKKRNLNTVSYLQAKHMLQKNGLTITHWYGFGVLPKFLYRFSGGRIPFLIDRFLTNIPGMKFISYNMIFICKRI